MSFLPPNAANQLEPSAGNDFVELPIASVFAVQLKDGVLGKGLVALRVWY